jgi:hypothetical protein
VGSAQGVLATEVSDLTWELLTIAYNNIWAVNQAFKETRERATLTPSSHSISERAESGVGSALRQLESGSG